jgi:hypothetical protein
MAHKPSDGRVNDEIAATAASPVARRWRSQFFFCALVRGDLLTRPGIARGTGRNLSMSQVIVEIRQLDNARQRANSPRRASDTHHISFVGLVGASRQERKNGPLVITESERAQLSSARVASL